MEKEKTMDIIARLIMCVAVYFFGFLIGMGITEEGIKYFFMVALFALIIWSVCWSAFRIGFRDL